MRKGNLKAKICRFCFNTKCEIDLKVVEVIKEVLEIVLPKLNLVEGDEHLICNSCSVKLFAAFNFKSVCTDTEDTIFPYVNSQEMPLADLRDVYVKEKGDIQLIDILKYQKICRLCFQSVGHGFVSLNEVDVDIIDNYIPEVNFNATKDPVICKVCSESLATHGAFLSYCLAAQEENRNVSGSPAEYRECCIKTEEIKIEDDWERYKKVCDSPAEDRERYIKTEEITIEDDCNRDPLPIPENVETIKNSKGRCNAKNIPVKKRKVTYTCNRCDFKTTYKSSLKRHSLNHISLTTTDTSSKSQRESESRETSSPCPLKDQVQMLQCKKCPYRTHVRHAFVRHWWTHKAPAEVTVYQCEKCHYRVTREDQLRRHQQRHEDSAETIENLKTGLSSENIPVKRRKATYTCNSCDFKTKFKSNLTRHCSKHNSLTPTYISKSRDASSPCPSRDQARMFQCERCPYRTHLRQAIVSHRLTHEVPSEVKMYQCEICHYRVKQKNRFRTHQLSHEDGERVQIYTCDTCDFQTRYKSSLATHQLMHEKKVWYDGQRMYRCDVCKHETKTRRQFLAHRCHQVSPKLKCHTCAYESDNENKLMKHQAKHSEVKLHKCKMCSFQSMWRYNFERHLWCHKQKCEVKTYDCDKCSFKSKYKDNLKRHAFQHSALE